jgi:hypothetical protein
MAKAPKMESAMAPETSDPRQAPNQGRRPCQRGARGILKAAAALLALGLVFWPLWNWAAVPLFTFPPLTYLQGLGAVMLTALSVGIGAFATARRRRSMLRARAKLTSHFKAPMHPAWLRC